MTRPQVGTTPLSESASGWRVVLISAFALFIIFGIRLSFSVFFAEFVSEEGWSNESAAMIFSVSMLAFALGSAPSGILLDRFGPRRVFTLGAILLAVGLFLSSRVSTITQLAITYGVIGGLGLSVIGLGPIAANISAWIPPAGRGRAIGIAFAGTGLGSLTFVPLAELLIRVLSWREAYLILSLICFFVLAPALAFGLVNPKREPPMRLDKPSRAADAAWSKLIRKPTFWALMIVSLTALGPVRSLTVHQIAYMESVGIERSVASTVVGFAGFVTAGMFVVWGAISDRYGRAIAFGLGAVSLLASVGILLLLGAVQSVAMLVLYALLYAFGESSRSSQTTAIASDIFQSSGLGLVNGLVGAMFGLGAAFGPWIVGRLRDSTGSYFPGLMTVVLMILISIVGFIFVAREGYRE